MAYLTKPVFVTMLRNPLTGNKPEVYVDPDPVTIHSEGMEVVWFAVGCIVNVRFKGTSPFNEPEFTAAPGAPAHSGACATQDQPTDYPYEITASSGSTSITIDPVVSVDDSTPWPHSWDSEGRKLPQRPPRRGAVRPRPSKPKPKKPIKTMPKPKFPRPKPLKPRIPKGPKKRSGRRRGRSR